MTRSYTEMARCQPLCAVIPARTLGSGRAGAEEGAEDGRAGGQNAVAKLGVLIVDDNDDMRAMVRGMIELANQGLSVAGEAVDGDEALRRWREDRPDVVLMDQQMPGLSGLEAAERILRESPNQAVIIFTAFLTETVQAEADRIGVKACVRKDDARKVVARLRECAAA